MRERVREEEDEGEREMRGKRGSKTSVEGENAFKNVWFEHIHCSTAV